MRISDWSSDVCSSDLLRGTVHRTVEVGFGGHLAAAGAGLVLGDEPRRENGVDRHLLAGHRVEGEAGADLGDSAGTVGDHHELDDHEDEEDHEADDHGAADHEVTEALDHLAGEAVEQHQARSEEHTSELQSLMRISYAVFCLKKT